MNERTDLVACSRVELLQRESGPDREIHVPVGQGRDTGPRRLVGGAEHAVNKKD